MFTSKFKSNPRLSAGSVLAACTLASASASHAAVVQINIASIAGGVADVSGVNAGLTNSTESGLYWDNFLSAGLFDLTWNDGGSAGFASQGLGVSGGIEFLITSGPASAGIVGQGVEIASAAPLGMSWSDDPTAAYFAFGVSEVPPFAGSGFMGFRVTDGLSNEYYGYIEVTWDGTNFEILSAAYENTAFGSIFTPAIPLPGAAGLAACGLLASARRRRR